MGLSLCSLGNLKMAEFEIHSVKNILKNIMDFNEV